MHPNEAIEACYTAMLEVLRTHDVAAPVGVIDTARFATGPLPANPIRFSFGVKLERDDKSAATMAEYRAEVTAFVRGSVASRRGERNAGERPMQAMFQTVPIFQRQGAFVGIVVQGHIGD